MTTKHTPGPWTYERLYPHKKGCAIGTGNLTNPTASTLIATAWNTTKGLSGPQDEETEANARLIAAAPELLEALQGMMHHHDHDQVGWPQDQCLRCQTAFAAIAKAEGRE